MRALQDVAGLRCRDRDDAIRIANDDVARRHMQPRARDGHVDVTRAVLGGAAMGVALGKERHAAFGPLHHVADGAVDDQAGE